MFVLKRKHILIFALLFSLLLPVISGCAGGDEGLEPVDYIGIIENGVSSYKIVRPEVCSEDVLNSAVQLRQLIEDKTGAVFLIETDWVKRDTEPDPEAFEILVGNTNREESKTAHDKIDGTGFVIEIIGNKVAIAASNDYVLTDAVKYFINTYMSGTEVIGNGYFKLPENLAHVSEPYASVDIVKESVPLYTLVRADNSPQYIIDLSLAILDAIEAETGVRLKIATDWSMPGTEPDSEAYEILVGATNRPESAQVMDDLAFNEYGVAAVGNKIVISGYSFLTADAAAAEFISLVKANAGQKTDGKADLSFAALPLKKLSYGGWISEDIPEYDGGTFGGLYDSNNGSYQIYMTGTTESEFDAYRKKLEGAGFSLLQSNEANGNIFATYIRDKTQIHTYFVKYQKAVRIIVGSVGVMLLTEEDQKHEKLTDSQITHVCLNYISTTWGLSVVIRLDDGSFIVIDGGGKDPVDAKKIYDILVEQNVRPGNPVIAAWYLTHSHYDHYSIFSLFAQNYSSKVDVEMFIANQPAESECAGANNPNYYVDKNFPALANNFGGIDLLVPLTGQKFFIRNAEFEVIYTHNDLYPERVATFNNTTTVLRMTLGGQTVMWLGDIETNGSNIATKMYGDYLKSDIVQVAHHGYNGGTVDLYKAIGAQTVLWPSSPDLSRQNRAANTHLQNDPGVIEHHIAYKGTKTFVMPYAPVPTPYQT